MDDDPPSDFLTTDTFGFVLWEYSYSAGFVFVAGLLILSAMISASEVAFFSLTAEQLEKCRNSKKHQDKNIVKLLKTPRLLLATILILNNFVNMAIVTLSTFLMWGIVATRDLGEIAIGILMFSVTFSIAFFGEIVPKVYVLRYAMCYSRLTSNSWKAMQKVCRPLSWLLLNMGNFVEKRFKKQGYTSTVKELNQALELTTTNNRTTQKEKDILKGIVNFGILSVKQIMKSRVDIFSIEYDMNFKELKEKVENAGFSRIPVCHETLDKIKGILYIKDLLPYLDQNNFAWQKLIRPSLFVPETKKLDSLLKDFQSKKIHMALIVDEYGGTLGLVTLEDLIEEIIGEITDEFDETNVSFTKVDSHTFSFEGKTLLHDFCKATTVNFEVFDSVKGENDSLGGLILELNHVMPKVGDKIKFDRFTFTILSADSKRIRRIQVYIGLTKGAQRNHESN